MFTKENTKMIEASIRTYQENDFERVVALIEAHIPEFFAAEERADFEHYLQHERELYFVLEQDGNIIACGGLNFFPQNNEARISWDLVDKNYHGKGVGAALLQYRLTVLLSMPEIKTVVVRTTQLVFPFYQKHGFELQHIEKNYWAKGLDLYLMHRDNITNPPT